MRSSPRLRVSLPAYRAIDRLELWACLRELGAAVDARSDTLPPTCLEFIGRRGRGLATTTWHMDTWWEQDGQPPVSRDALARVVNGQAQCITAMQLADLLDDSGIGATYTDGSLLTCTPTGRSLDTVAWDTQLSADTAIDIVARAWEAGWRDGAELRARRASLRAHDVPGAWPVDGRVRRLADWLVSSREARAGAVITQPIRTRARELDMECVVTPENGGLARSVGRASQSVVLYEPQGGSLDCPLGALVYHASRRGLRVWVLGFAGGLWGPAVRPQGPPDDAR